MFYQKVQILLSPPQQVSRFGGNDLHDDDDRGGGAQRVDRSDADETSTRQLALTLREDMLTQFPIQRYSSRAKRRLVAE